MKRRDFVASLSAAVLWPAKAAAQPKPVLGFLNGGSPEGYARMALSFRQGLKDAGFVDGENLVVEYRWADGQFDRLPQLAADLVRRQVTLIAATTTPAALAARAATTTIPIVFTTSGDPVRLGLVRRLTGQGGNLTGATQMNVETASKRLALLHELIPAARTVAVLMNPTNPTVATQSDELKTTAHRLGIQIHFLHASTEPDLDIAFASLNGIRADGLVIGSADPFFTSRTKQLAALALRYRIPAVYQYAEFTAAGGLMSYGGSIIASYYLAGVYAGRILKGEKPGDLPVQQTTKFDLVINLKTAQALGIEVPLAILAHADEVVE
jgi:putative ABC transport system substrate-binding protein